MVAAQNLSLIDQLNIYFIYEWKTGSPKYYVYIKLIMIKNCVIVRN